MLLLLGKKGAVMPDNRTKNGKIICLRLATGTPPL